MRPTKKKKNPKSQKIRKTEGKIENDGENGMVVRGKRKQMTKAAASDDDFDFERRR